MNDSFTIGGNTPAPERGPYASALRQHIEDGTRWQELPDVDRERLACLYAAEHCSDSLIGHMLERSLWDAIARAVPIMKDYAREGGEKFFKAERELAANASVQFDKLAWAALAECESTVRRHYLDAWDAAHGDVPDAVHPGAGR